MKGGVEMAVAREFRGTVEFVVGGVHQIASSQDTE
jgi:hypothetical protein